MTGLSAPHSSTLRARKKMNGTGIMLPMMEMMYTCHSGRPSPTPMGDRAAQLDQRHHRDEKYSQIFSQHNKPRCSVALYKR